MVILVSNILAHIGRIERERNEPKAERNREEGDREGRRRQAWNQGFSRDLSDRQSSLVSLIHP